MKERIERIETLERSGAEAVDFSPEVTTVVTGLKYTEEEDILQKVKDLIRIGLGLNINVKQAMRTPPRNGKPGTVVKIEFQSKLDKITVLKKKKDLRNSNGYKNVYMRSSQSHMERMLHSNTMTILKEMGADKKYTFLGGKLINKDQQNADRTP